MVHADFRNFLLLALLLFSGPFGSDLQVGVYTQLSDPGIWPTSTPQYGDALYETNEAYAYGFEVQYKRFGFAMSPSFFGESQDSPTYPPTKFFDLGTYYYGDAWGVETYYQYFRGFYASYRDTSLNNSSLWLHSFDVNLYHSINKSSNVFCMREGIDKTGIKWNFYYLFAAATQSMLSPTPLFPGSDTTNNAKLDDLRRLKTLQAFAAVGATLNTNLFGFYADPTVFIGYGPQYRWTNADIDKFGFGLKANLKLESGYRCDRLGLGLSVQNDLNSVEAGDENVEFHSTILKFFLSVSM